ncbi:hypothetical protein ILYODFUR_022601 [Ilyodon furcidens]|uniref:Uncharacterized protein n=1 Tax=Ilyodon furcidens TaxID=33524 RepID=A0ABV0SQY7_9TELE
MDNRYKRGADRPYLNEEIACATGWLLLPPEEQKEKHTKAVLLKTCRDCCADCCINDPVADFFLLFHFAPAYRTVPVCFPLLGPTAMDFNIKLRYELFWNFSK